MPIINPAELKGGRLIAALLDTIAYCEIGPDMLRQSANGYDVIVGSLPGRMNLMPHYEEHPRTVVALPGIGRTNAAGRYQIMAAVPGQIVTDTWDWASRACKVRDFSPESQDIVAGYLARRRGALEHLERGDIELAFVACRKEWASLPGAGYGQREHSLQKVLSVYQLSLRALERPGTVDWLAEIASI